MKRKRKKRVSNSGRNTLENTFGESVRAGYEALEFEGCHIAEFMPNLPNAESQLWFTLFSEKRGDLTLRFKSPDTIGDIIEQLVFYRKKIWADAPELDFDKDFSKEEE